MRVRVIHWREEEAGPLIEACRAGGFEVDYEAGPFHVLSRAIRKTPPDAIVIDLSRRPSHGREVGVAWRVAKYSRHIPMVYVEGDPEKVEAVRQLMPDATYTSLTRVAAAIKAAIRKRIADPTIPAPVMEQYGGRTVAQKLGMKPGMTVGVYAAPRDYMSSIGELPGDVELVEDPDESHPLTLWFVRDPHEYRAALGTMRRLAARSKLWVIWHKATAGGELTDKIVRAWANEKGLVDYKICAVDKRWSGMLFAVKKT